MELSEARKQLDRIDAGMLELFQRRMEVVTHVAQYKEERNLPVRDPVREQQIIDATVAGIDPALAPYAARFVTEIMAISCDYQSDRRKK